MKEKIFNNLRKIIYSATYLIARLTPFVKVDGIVLCYHSISDDGWDFSISPDVLKKQIEYLLKNYEPYSIEDLKEYFDGRKINSKPFFVLTFDDGYQNIYGIKDYLSSLKIKPIVFLLSGGDYVDRRELDNNLPLLTNEEILNLKILGWSIGSHGATHADFENIDEKQKNVEIIDSKRVLEEKFGGVVNYFSYPKGRYNDSVLKLVRSAGYDMAFVLDTTTKHGLINKRDGRFKIPRIGVMGTHSFQEFKSILSPYSILLRGLFYSARRVN